MDLSRSFPLMFFFLRSPLLRRFVPVNCRTPTAESTRLSLAEKRDWALFVLAITIVPGSLLMWQFDSTSAMTVNQQVREELARRRTTSYDDPTV